MSVVVKAPVVTLPVNVAAPVTANVVETVAAPVTANVDPSKDKFPSAVIADVPVPVSTALLVKLDAPVPPSATVKSVIPVIVPPAIVAEVKVPLDALTEEPEIKVVPEVFLNSYCCHSAFKTSFLKSSNNFLFWSKWAEFQPQFW